MTEASEDVLHAITILRTLSKLDALGTAENLRLEIDELQHGKALGTDGIPSGVIRVAKACYFNISMIAMPLLD